MDNISQHDTSVSLNPEGIPTELKQSARWVRWQLEDVNEEGKLRKSAKVPKNAKTGANASHSDFNTWTSYDVALAAHRSNLPLKPDPNSVAVHDRRGIGYVFGPPFWGKDYDHCVINGVIDPEVEEDLIRLDTYAEFSQSGTGIHAIGHNGNAPENGHRKDNREIYGRKRFFVFTGNPVPGFAKPIRRFTDAETKAEFDKVAAGKKQFTPMSAKREELMTKTDFPDLSVAVQSLLTDLAYENCDPDFIDKESLGDEHEAKADSAFARGANCESQFAGENRGFPVFMKRASRPAVPVWWERAKYPQDITKMN